MTLIILASQSAARKQLLTQAGVPFKAMPARIDEDMVKMSLEAEGATPRDIADTLAELKAQRVANKHPDQMVLGSDQVLAFQGKCLSKAANPNALKEQLAMLQGQTHSLLSAAVIYKDHEPMWRHVGTARMSMRTLSAQFIDDYVETYWSDIQYCVGGYRAEAEGIRLFSSIQGDMPTIMGLPLLPLLAFLALHDTVAT
ncbi:Maf family protein [Shimia ponticola]|uniref:Maf family protein n=1 Tax=Shimia ponticola TaxID=2582893 RepID=UPI0011BD5FB2|nr:nucleoside triphosphate pyrophosphatase [Shimia ponticola]